MKNNRQIGLDGKTFISDCLKRSVYFVCGLILFGIVGAAADILKLTGSSGAVMSTFTVSLLVYDFISMLVLIIVTFYAHFLECGGNIPILKGRPLVFLCWFRMGYSVLLAYYIAYRVFYIAANPGSGQAALMIYYIIYFMIIFLSIISESFIINILTRNIIRRSYEVSFRRLAYAGVCAQLLLPIAYIFARIFLKDLGDEWFTASFCDFLRLCIAPILYTSLWLIYVGAVNQVGSVFEEVDTALREKRYQITYSDANQPKGLKSGGRKKRKKNSVRKNAAQLPPPKSAAALTDGSDTQKKKNIEALPKAEPKNKKDDDEDNNKNDKGQNVSSDSGVAESAGSASKESSNEAVQKKKESESASKNESKSEKKQDNSQKEKTESKKSAEEIRREEAMRIRQQVRYVNPAAPQLHPTVQDFDPYSSAGAPVPSGQQTAGNLRLAPRLPLASPGLSAPHSQARQMPTGIPRQTKSSTPTNGGSVYYPPHNSNSSN